MPAMGMPGPEGADASGMESLEKKAHFYASDVMQLCASVRELCDKLEEVVDDNFWPLPKYHEMLFIG